MARLINEKTGIEVKKGDVLTDFRGDTAVFRSFAEPHKPSSTGKVYTEKLGASYPSVYGLKIVDHQFSNVIDQMLDSGKMKIIQVGDVRKVTVKS